MGKIKFVGLAIIVVLLTGCPGGVTMSDIDTMQYNACVDYARAEPVVVELIKAKAIKPSSFDKINKARQVGKYWCGTVPQPKITDPAVLADLLSKVAVLTFTADNKGQ